MIYINHFFPSLLFTDDILKFIQDGFSIHQLSSYAAAAVQSICHKCKGQLAHLFDSLVTIIQTADNMGMSNNAVVGLLTGKRLHDGLNECVHVHVKKYHIDGYCCRI